MLGLKVLILCTHKAIINLKTLSKIYFSDQDNCIRGFPNTLVSEVSGRTRNDMIRTLLIPAMNFTCNASIVGFIVAGERLKNWPHCKIHIWQRNSSQNLTFTIRLAAMFLSMCQLKFLEAYVWRHEKLLEIHFGASYMTICKFQFSLEISLG